MADEAAEQQAGGTDGPSPGGSPAIIRLALAAVIVAAAAGGGYFAAKAFSRPAKAGVATEAATEAHAEAEPAKEGKEKEKEKEKETEKEGEAASSGEFKCYQMDSIIANLNEPRLARYIRATVTLSIKNADFKAAETTLKENKSRVKDWMTRYLMGCTLDDVRGRDNHNRIRKEIQASLNEQLWPQQRPLIAEVFFEEFNVQ